MAYDLASAYLRLGLTAPTPALDAELEAQLNAALAIVENWLNRYLFWRADQIEVLFIQNRSLQVSRFPISQVTRISPSASHEVHNDTGIILFPHHVINRRVEIEYEGGYLVLPADLELALWATFDAVHGLGQTGGSVGLQAGEVSSVTLQGVGTVRFSDGGSTTAVARTDDDSLIPAWARVALSPYRLWGT